jgi:NodT family efflux transporter outer membrane factor (OMF) lipoprotein
VNRSIFAAACGLILLTSCGVGPQYHKPVAPQPAAPDYKETGNWKQAAPRDAFNKGKWWEIFSDPMLNTLEEQIAVSNENLKVARARFYEARAVVKQNRAGFLPSILGGASVTATHQSDNRPLSHADYTDYTVPIDISYEADVWGRVQYNVNASNAAAQASAADLETVNLSVHAELALDYFQLRGLDAEKQLLDETVASYEKALELTQNRFNGGIASKGDVAKAETQVETTRAQAVDVTMQRAQLEHAIATLMGKPATDFTLAFSPLASDPPDIPTGVPSELLERRPDIAAAERRVSAANSQIGVARSAFFPVLSLQAPTGLESASLLRWLTGPSALFGLGPAAVLPLFDAGRRKAVSDQMRSSYDEAVASYQQTVLSAFQDVENSLAALRILNDEAQIQDQAVAAAKRSLDISTDRYKGGLATYLEVTSAQSIALANERTAVQLLKQRTTTSVQLIKAIGGGWNASNLPSN